jgi:hypothetical protein
MLSVDILNVISWMLTSAIGLVLLLVILYVVGGLLALGGGMLARLAGWHPEQSAGHRERPPVPLLLRAAVLARDGHACVKCGATEDLQMDHVIPFSQGGPTTLDNLETLCGPCNRKKGVHADVC